MKIAPDLALVLAWHYAMTPGPQVPDWARQHPQFPKAFSDYLKLATAAGPAIARIERKLAKLPEAACA
jgi:hypothetical protein